MPAPFGEERKNGRRGFLNRTACDVNQRPIVPGAEPPRSGDFLSHRLLIDVFVIVAMGFEAKQPVLPDLHDAFG